MNSRKSAVRKGEKTEVLRRAFRWGGKELKHRDKGKVSAPLLRPHSDFPLRSLSPVLREMWFPVPSAQFKAKV